MGSVPLNRTDSTSVEALLAGELMRADRALRGVAPVISHMLDASGEALVNDAVLARLRGMLAHLARQMIVALGDPAYHDTFDDRHVDELSEVLAADPAILSHLYAVAIEGLLTQQLEKNAALDPVLSPLLQELIASDKPATAELAMKALAAQSRFMQSQNRMELALGELPSDLFATVLQHFEQFSGASDAQRALSHLRSQYDEGAGRIGLLARLTASMRNGAVAGLSLEHAGFALFASCLSELSGQPRNLAVLACHERQAARLALALRSAGLDSEEIEKQLQTLRSDAAHAYDLAAVAPERARAMLAQSALDGAFQGGAV